MNLTTLLSTLRTFLQEDTAAFWSDPELTVYLNDGDLQVIKDIQGGGVYRTTTSVSGQAAYPLPPYCIEINRVTYGSTNTELYRLTGLSDCLTGNSGTPTGYWLPRHSNKMYLDPVPSSSGDTIKVHGRFKSADMATGTDVPESPDVLHMAIVHWAAMLAWQKRKDAAQARDSLGLYRMAIDSWDGPVDAGPMYTIRRNW